MIVTMYQQVETGLLLARKLSNPQRTITQTRGPNNEVISHRFAVIFCFTLERNNKRRFLV